MNYDFTINYFGPPHLRKDYERQVAPPVGTPCLLCEEAIAEGDTGTIDPVGRVIHYECQLRGIVGSVGHQMKRCSCFGGSEEDPPGMTRRQAALAAAALWQARQPELD